MNKTEFENHGYDTSLFSLVGMKGWARVVACHDGDSPTLVMSYGGQMHKFHTRLYGVDTAEISCKDPVKKEKAVVARNRLIQLCTDCHTMPVFRSDKDVIRFLGADVYIVWVECLEFDKYGRLLVNLRKTPDDEMTFSDLLIQENHAYAYYGGKKQNM